MDRERTSLWALWIIVIVAGCWLGWSALKHSIDQTLHTLHRRTEGQQLRLSSSSDGPFIVFGIAAYGFSEGDKRWAPLDPPLVIMDSAGGSIDLKKLHWRDYRNDEAPPPTDQRLYPLYVRPEPFDAYPHD